MRVATILLVVLAILSAATAAKIPTLPERIIGGSVTTIDEYPFSTSLLFSSNLVSYSQSCGGSILNSRSVLSAAHCFFLISPVQWRIRVGSTWANSGGIVHFVARSIIHPNYSHNSLDNDIAILHSSTTISFVTNAVQPASIAGLNYNIGDNQVVWAIGWGVTSLSGLPSEQLRHVQIWTINQEICRNNYESLGWDITDNMLCTGWIDVGGRDQCYNDSGSPVLHNNVIVGLYSFGYFCAVPRFFSINTRVSRYTHWIQANA